MTARNDYRSGLNKSLLSAILGVFLVFAPIVHIAAETPVEQEIATEAAREAALDEAKKMVADTISQEFAETFTEFGIANGPEVILNGAGLAIEIYNFGSAKNDKQKFYAASKGAVYAVALAGGPAAPIIVLAIAVIQMVDAGLTARHQEAMLEIFRNIEEHIRVIKEINTQFVNAEIEEITANYYLALAAAATVTEGKRYLERNCISAEKYQSMKDIDQCIKWSVNTFEYTKRFIRFSERILGWDGKFVKVSHFFKPVNPNGMEFSEFKSLVEKQKKAVEKNKNFYANIIDIYSEIIWELVKNPSQKDQDKDRQLEFVALCGKRGAEISRFSQAIEVELARGVMLEKFNKLGVFEMLGDRISAFERHPCFSVKKQDLVWGRAALVAARDSVILARKRLPRMQ